eukprot:XP_016664436.1 PREDICTED: uncharacterized protein LOC107885325 [Acyrthosiphon pisum]
MPSTSKSVYYPDYNLNSILFCEETISDSPTSTSEEQNNQKERKKALQELYEERETDSAVYAKNHPLNKPNTLMDATKEKKIEEHANVFQKFTNNHRDGDEHGYNPLMFLAEISCIYFECINEGIEPRRVFETPEITSSQRQAEIIDEMNKAQSLIKKIKKRLAKLHERMIRIRKRKTAKDTTTI